MVAWKSGPHTSDLLAPGFKIWKTQIKNPEFQLILEKKAFWEHWGHTPSQQQLAGADLCPFGRDTGCLQCAITTSHLSCIHSQLASGSF